jgi:hypothetical protein
MKTIFEKHQIAFNLDMYKLFYEKVYGVDCPELNPDHWSVKSSLNAASTLKERYEQTL